MPSYASYADDFVGAECKLVVNGSDIVAYKSIALWFNENGGTYATENSYVYYNYIDGISAPTITPPTKTGYEFLGWSLSYDDTLVITTWDASNIGVEDGNFYYSLYAVWKHVDHEYTDNFDTTCNVCSATRTISHEYSGDCDASCNECGATRTVTASHTYDNDSDTTCNDCGATRTVATTPSTPPATSGPSSEEAPSDTTEETPAESTSTSNFEAWQIVLIVFCSLGLIACLTYIVYWIVTNKRKNK